MIEVLPKIADVKSLRELSKIIILPMLIASYLIQTNMNIHGMSVDENAIMLVQLLQFILVFLLSSAEVGFIAIIIYGILVYAHVYTNFIALSLFATLFLALGFLGVFGKEVPLIRNLENMWFYTCFVCGFYLLSLVSEIEEKIT